jgi:hypothetical protein
MQNVRFWLLVKRGVPRHDTRASSVLTAQLAGKESDGSALLTQGRVTIGSPMTVWEYSVGPGFRLRWRWLFLTSGNWKKSRGRRELLLDLVSGDGHDSPEIGTHARFAQCPVLLPGCGTRHERGRLPASNQPLSWARSEGPEPPTF